MDTNFHTLSSLTALAIEHDADFEVINGVTTHKDKRVRAQMILALNNCPSVIISFGDKQHGQRVSRVELEANQRVSVKIEDVIRYLRFNSTTKQWKATMNRETPLFNIETVAGGKVKVTGIINSKETLAFTDMDEVENPNYTYGVIVRNHVMNASTSEVTELAQLRMNFEVPPHVGLSINQRVEAVGTYIFPHTVRVEVLASV